MHLLNIGLNLLFCVSAIYIHCSYTNTLDTRLFEFGNSKDQARTGYLWFLWALEEVEVVSISLVLKQWLFWRAYCGQPETLTDWNTDESQRCEALGFDVSQLPKGHGGRRGLELQRRILGLSCQRGLIGAEWILACVCEHMHVQILGLRPGS